MWKLLWIYWTLTDLLQKWPLHWVTSLTLDRLCSSLPQGQGWGCPPQQQGSSSSFCRAWTTLWGQSCSEGLHCGFQPDCFLFKRFLKTSIISNSPQCRRNTHAEISLKELETCTIILQLEHNLKLTIDFWWQKKKWLLNCRILNLIYLLY